MSRENQPRDRGVERSEDEIDKLFMPLSQPLAEMAQSIDKITHAVLGDNRQSQDEKNDKTEALSNEKKKLLIGVFTDIYTRNAPFLSELIQYKLSGNYSGLGTTSIHKEKSFEGQDILQKMSETIIKMIREGKLVIAQINTKSSNDLKDPNYLERLNHILSAYFKLSLIRLLNNEIRKDRQTIITPDEVFADLQLGSNKHGTDRPTIPELPVSAEDQMIDIEADKRVDMASNTYIQKIVEYFDEKSRNSDPQRKKLTRRLIVLHLKIEGVTTRDIAIYLLKKHPELCQEWLVANEKSSESIDPVKLLKILNENANITIRPDKAHQSAYKFINNIDQDFIRMMETVEKIFPPENLTIDEIRMLREERGGSVLKTRMGMRKKGDK